MSATTSRDVYRQTDVVTLLHREFGPRKSWRDFLADCIRRDSRCEGLGLLPCGYTDTKMRRPVYAVEDVAAFITELAKRVPLQPLEILTVDLPVVPYWLPRSSCRAVITGSRKVH